MWLDVVAALGFLLLPDDRTARGAVGVIFRGGSEVDDTPLAGGAVDTGPSAVEWSICFPAVDLCFGTAAAWRSIDAAAAELYFGAARARRSIDDAAAERQAWVHV